MFKATPKLVLFICVLSTIILASLNFISPSLKFLNSGVILIILMTNFIRRNFYTYLFGFFSILIIISRFMFDGTLGNQTTWGDLLGPVAVALVTTFVVIYIKNLNRSIEYDRKQMNAMFEYATEGIVLTNGKGEIVLVNPEASRLFMYDSRELIGKPIEILIPKECMDRM